LVGRWHVISGGPRPSGTINDVPDRSDLEGFYRRYNGVCNEHRFDRLSEFVAEDVRVNGDAQGLAGYIAGLRDVIRAFPDYQWELRHLLIDGDWIAAHFIDTGTHRDTAFGIAATGRAIHTQEFALYGINAGKIVEVWVTADNLQLLNQLHDHDGTAAGGTR
jgi:predicted ester cyclase